MKKISLLWLLGVFALVPAAQAQWQTITYTLRGGWNAIYLQGDVTYTTPDLVFARTASVVSVWRWNPNPNPAQFKVSAVTPSASSPEWSVWRKGDSANSTLTSLAGQTAYLVQCSGSAADTYTLTITQQMLPPRSMWLRTGANFLGFPATTGATAPTLSAYFSTFPSAIASNARVYKYVGGPLGTGNPIQIYSPSTEKIDSTQAYWFEAMVVGDFSAPIEIKPVSSAGLAFGRTQDYLTVRLFNRTAAAVTVTVAPVASGSLPDQITIANNGTVTATPSPVTLAAVPLRRRTFNAATSTYTETAITGSYTEVIPPLSEVQLTFGVDRTLMTAPVGTAYGSFLRFTDAGNLMNALLPCSASVTSPAGLWVGDALLSNVVTQAPGGGGSVAGGTYPLRIILHVDDAGLVRLLSKVYIGKIAGSTSSVGLTLQESDLQTDTLASAQRISAAHLPLDLAYVAESGSAFAAGGRIELEVPLAFTDRTNPFVHTYHPDHDNRDAQFRPLTAPGIESYTVVRSIALTFGAAATGATLGTSGQAGTPTTTTTSTNTDVTAPLVGSSSGPASTIALSAPLTWSANTVSATYQEQITGLHRATLSVSGSVKLNRISEIGTLK